MGRIFAFVACLLTLSTGAARAANTVLSYRGKVLRPHVGSGVAGARNLHFEVSGHLPASGMCRTDFKILNVSDGRFSLKDALAGGYTPRADNKVKICRDARSGALSERLNVNVALFRDANLLAYYTWSSSDPRRGQAADTITAFANYEYHVSEAKRPGRLMIDTSE